MNATGNVRLDALIRQKPPMWEYHLTTELLLAGLRPIHQSLDDLQSGRVFVARKAVTEHEFLQFSATKANEYATLADEATRLFNEEVMAAWGPSGVPADADAIICAVNKILQHCGQLYEWERALRAIIPPSEYTQIHQAMQGWAVSIFKAVEEPPETMRRLLANPGLKGQHVIAVTIPKPPNMDVLQQELDRIRATKNLQAACLTALQQPQIQSPNTAGAALLAGILGAMAGACLFKERKPDCSSGGDAHSL